jgi:hypothetical protein
MRDFRRIPIEGHAFSPERGQSLEWPAASSRAFLFAPKIVSISDPTTVKASHMQLRSLVLDGSRTGCGAGMNSAVSSHHAVQVASVRVATHPRYFTYFVGLFLLSLPLVNPWVRGDGVGYYAYARSMLINHNLHFETDWLAANSSFIEGRVDGSGHLRPDQFSSTGYVRNHFSVGPAILWAPFLIAVHFAVLLANRFGANIPADGFSRPYLETMAAATALYGFCGLLLAFDMARRYFDQTYAFLGTLGIWLASSLPVYMYFNPSWSHAQSAFAVALFLWYWLRTRDRRSLRQWAVLGLLAGLMMNIYYPNAILLLLPGLEAAQQYRVAFQNRNSDAKKVSGLFAEHLVFALVALLALAPTFITRRILYGSALATDYPPIQRWFWFSPKLLTVLFSADHGLLSWTPVLLPAILGLIIFWRRDPLFGGGLLLSFIAYFYFIASYPDWDGISSFGNRFFVPLTALFVIGLAASLDFFVRHWRCTAQGIWVAATVLAVLVLWNAGLIFQWGTQMIPARGAISWSQAARNQYDAVPQRAVRELQAYLLHRKNMMQEIDQQDLDGLKRQSQ